MQNQAGIAAAESGNDLFVLTDEQILEIAPASTASAPVAPPFFAGQERTSDAAAARPEIQRLSVSSSQPKATSDFDRSSAKTAQPEMAVGQEPPAWLAAQMQDPWGGEEAREFWDGVQQARSEAAAYRAAIASPEDARALKELYPGGVSEARAAAERARLLDDVDRAYFGAAGNSREQTSASRAQLAQRMLREDPAAFREMVEAGVRVLQEASNAQGHRPKSLASALSGEGNDGGATTTTPGTVGAQHASSQVGNASVHEAQVAAYAAFERAANEDLERSVGTAIERTLTQALPSFEQHNTPGQAGAQRAAPLRERLAASVRVDVEKALQGDRQLGEQVAQILSSRRFGNEARAQIVRLIGERAQQLVPGAAKRVLNEWTQTTLAAHRGRTQPAEAASARAEVASASTPAHPAGNEKTHAGEQSALRSSPRANAAKSQVINYRKLSDEQILEM
jgi:hypothetical protein